MNKVKNIAELHDEILEILLEYREKYNSDLTCALRSPESKSYLDKGFWFWEDGNCLYTYFIDDDLPSNLSLFIDDNGKLSFFFDLILIEFAEKTDFVKKALKIDRNIIRQRSFNLNFYEYEFKEKFMVLLKIIDEFLNSKAFQENDNYSTISKEEFDKSLKEILQKRKELKEFEERQQKGFPYDIINRGKKPQKVFVTDFNIENYYAIKSTKIQNLPKEAPWIFLTGENGAGKSLVLQGLAIGIYGNREEAIIPEGKKTTIKLIYQSKAGDIYKNDTLKKPFITLPYLACFGPIRLDILTEGSENKSTKRSTATYGIFGNYDALLKNIETELKFAFYENEQKYQVLVTMLKQVIPSLHEVKFNKRKRVIDYIEKDTKGNEEIYKAVSFSELATGIKSIIAMVGDIYLRFSELAQKGVKTGKYLSPEELYGIVIIDEIDLHLHPKWQKNLPTVLSGVFPNVQFIVSTHSAIPILGAPENSVLLRVNRNKEDGVTVERLEHLEKQLKNLTPNLILTSKIFGFQDIFPVTHDKSERIRTEDTMEDLEQNDEMMDALKSYMNTDKEEELLKLFSK